MTSTPNGGEDQPSGGTYPAPAPPEPTGYTAPPPGYTALGSHPVHGVKQTETMAIVALVLSLMGPASCGMSSLAGAILGRIALRKIREYPDHLEGEGLAKAAVIVGWIMFGVFVLVALAYVALIVFMVVMGIEHPH